MSAKTCKCNKVYENVLECIGNTPLVKLNRIPKDHGVQCQMFAKCEYLNPGGSIKDRIAYHMVMEAEQHGRVKPTTRFIEPTSGNTGIGLALTCALRGYACTIVTADKNSEEKLNTLRLLGSEVVVTPSSARFDDPDGEMGVAKRLLQEYPGSICLNQFENQVNPSTHFDYTATELLDALGTVDMFVMGIGTGGTITGVGRKLKQHNPNCIIVAVDPQGSLIYGGPLYPFLENQWAAMSVRYRNYYNCSPSCKHQVFGARLEYADHFEEWTIYNLNGVEGIGGDFVPKVLDKSIVDKVIRPNDNEDFNMSREMILKEGLFCGGSSGAITYSAIQAAKEYNLGPDKKVVIILPDEIRNYMSRFVCDQWMEAHLFKNPPERDYLWWKRSITNLKVNRSVPSVNQHKTCLDALAVMGSEHNVAFVVDDNEFLIGAVTKDNLRFEVTNPKRKSHMHFDDLVVKHILMKNYYKITENNVRATIGLASRILDIAPFVVVVEEYVNGSTNVSGSIPKGIITSDIVLDYMMDHQNRL